MDGGKGSVLTEHAQKSVIASRLRLHLVQNSPSGIQSPRRRDLESVNLNFTPSRGVIVRIIRTNPYPDEICPLSVQFQLRTTLLL